MYRYMSAVAITTTRMENLEMLHSPVKHLLLNTYHTLLLSGLIFSP